VIWPPKIYGVLDEKISIAIRRVPVVARCCVLADESAFRPGICYEGVSDMMEIQAAKLALSKQPDGDTKPFAERMVKDHEHTSMELKALVGSGKVDVALPTALDAKHQREIDELKAKSGKEFDRAYDPMQVKAHEQAVLLFAAYARDGDNPDLKTWAAKTLPHLKQHLAMAKKLTS
jgi:putative membrane protein